MDRPADKTKSDNQAPAKVSNQGFSLDAHHNWRKDFDDVKLAALWCWGLVLIVITPSLPTLITVFTSGRRAGLEQGQLLFQIFLLTFPLSLGVAVDTATILLTVKYKKWPKGDHLFYYWTALAGVFVISALIGNFFGVSEIPNLRLDKIKGGRAAIFVAAGNVIQTYFQLYGPQLFFSAVIVGMFSGWVFSMKIVPNFMPPDQK